MTSPKIEKNKKRPQRDITSHWSLYIGIFWILPPITLSKRLRVGSYINLASGG
jgi:hypothetical protein